MKTLVARCYIEWLTARAERIFFVYGMRRSGNHACVRWLANALEAERVVLREGQVQDNFYSSSSGKTVFLNNITDISGWGYVKLLNRHRDKLRHARFVIISVEDQAANYHRKWRIPRHSQKIAVRRGTLNVMASRFQSLNNLAQAGRDSGGHAMEAQFYSVLNSLLLAQEGSIWEFERWCGDNNWREAFLQKLGLNCDIPPEMSDEGGGSSFSGTQVLPSIDQLVKRFAAVEPRRPWIEFIQSAARDHPEVFRQDELDAIHAVAHDRLAGETEVPTLRAGAATQQM